jgi:hypothetical protein
VIAKADAICRRYNEQIAASKVQSTQARAEVFMKEITQVIPAHAALEMKAIAELARLKPPASLARDWKSILTYRRILANELLALIGAAKRKDAKAISVLAVSKKREHELLAAVAARDGFKDCAQAGGVSGSSAPPASVVPRAAL